MSSDGYQLVMDERGEAMSRRREQHWLAVGRVSNAAREQLIDADCHVVDVNSKPPIVLVGLRYETASGQFSENMALASVEERDQIKRSLPALAFS